MSKCTGMGKIKGVITECNYREMINKSHLTMSELEEYGFKVIKSYEHDDYITQRRKNRCVTIQTTWKKTGEFESQEFQIDDGEWRELNPKHFHLLCLIF